MDPAWILPPCTISPNTMDNGSFPISFNSVFVEAGITLYKGNFALTGNGNGGDMSFYFFEEPTTGKYITASSLDENSNMNCCVSGFFGGTFSFFYTAAANDTVYVENLGNGKYKMSFCNLNFFSTENSFFGKGNLKN